MLSSLLLLGSYGNLFISPTQKPDSHGITSSFVVDCMAGKSGVEVWTGNRSVSTYSSLYGSYDGFSTRVIIRKQARNKGDKSIPDNTTRCSARYRFFRILETCNGTLVQTGGDYGKIEEWKIEGPDTCADSGVTQWKACSGVRGMPSAQVCVDTYYCPDPSCTTVNGNGDTVSLSPNALKYDVNITGLESSTCGASAYFALDVRGAVKSDLIIHNDSTSAQWDALGGSCPIEFSWATGLVINGQVQPVNFSSCVDCDANRDEIERPLPDEHNHCCTFGLTQGSANTVFWDPALSFTTSAAPAAYSAVLGLLVAVTAFLF